MKRAPALVSLSHDHHQALRVAQLLRRADEAGAAEARGAFLAYWSEHGRNHFRIEEEVLLPAFAGHGDAHHPLVARVLCEHVVLRRHAAGIAADTEPAVAELRELGGRLAEHVRLEERELFPLIEATVPAAELTVVAATLEQAERRPADE